MAKYKLVFSDIRKDGKDGWECHMEDEDGNRLESLELEFDQVTPALMATLEVFDGLRFMADLIQNEEGQTVGGLELEQDNSTKH